MNVAFGYASQARVSGENQDAHGVFRFDGLTLGVVCDGVGGHTGGQQAAQLAVRTVAEAMSQAAGSDPAQALVEAITLANRAIYETGRKSHRLMGMSTTIVAVAIQDGVAVVAHVGDSRAYLVRHGEVRALTRDHTMVNMFVDNDLLSPEDAASHPEAHVLARSLGSERQVDVDVTHAPMLHHGDVILLCTDGLHGAVDEHELGNADWNQLEGAAAHLLRRASAQGTPDNATVALFRVGEGPPGMQPTQIPNLENPGDVLTPSSSDWVQTPDLHSEPLPPALYPIEPEDEPTAQDESAAGLLDTQEPASPTGTSSPLPPRVSSRTPPPEPEREEAPNRNRRRVLLIGGSSVVLAALILGGAFASRPLLSGEVPTFRVDMAGLFAWARTDTPEPTAPAEGDDASADADGTAGDLMVQTEGTGGSLSIDEGDPGSDPVEPAEAAPPTGSEPSAAFTQGDVNIVRQPGEWVHIELPPVKINRKTRSLYGNPVPSPTPRSDIANRIRAQRPCSEVEPIINDAMASSPEYAPLWVELWNCHQDIHQSALDVQLQGHHQFEEIRMHLEGRPEQPTGKKLPYWFLPATSGIERRMDLWEEHVVAGEAKLFDEVVMDAIYADIIAARFHHDLIIESALAIAFSEIEDPSPEQVQDWARRVYIARTHWERRVGEMVREYDSPAYNRVRNLLADATFDFEKKLDERLARERQEKPGATLEDVDWGALADELRLPREVARALLTSTGDLPPPSAEQVAKKEEQAPRGPRLGSQSPVELIKD